MLVEKSASKVHKRASKALANRHFLYFLSAVVTAARFLFNFGFGIFSRLTLKSRFIKVTAYDIFSHVRYDS